MGADEKAEPPTIDLASLEGGKIRFDDNGHPVLHVAIAHDVAFRRVAFRLAAGDSPTADRAGLRKLMDGLWALQCEVMWAALKLEREAEKAAAAEAAVVDADGLPDERVVEAMRHRTPQRPY